ncbi:MAG TPA: hypothetical protein PKA31_02250 [Candidatus Moranbacteria bacterium]|nr:hypothetical protein [Candidatus Moranbacteria bacterium]
MKKSRWYEVATFVAIMMFSGAAFAMQEGGVSTRFVLPIFTAGAIIIGLLVSKAAKCNVYESMHRDWHDFPYGAEIILLGYAREIGGQDYVIARKPNEKDLLVLSSFPVWRLADKYKCAHLLVRKREGTEVDIVGVNDIGQGADLPSGRSSIMA